MADSEVIFVNPFAVSAQQQGWRGLALQNTGQSSRRKAYTVLENEFILVTALVVLPGERSIRHYHETGELNISYIGENRPVIRWNPPGVLHGGDGGGRRDERGSAVAAADRLGEQPRGEQAGKHVFHDQGHRCVTCPPLSSPRPTRT